MCIKMKAIHGQINIRNQIEICYNFEVTASNKLISNVDQNKMKTKQNQQKKMQ